MTQSESINELASALCEAQREFAPASKDKVNPFYKQAYATLGSILEVLNPVLGKYGLSFTQLTDTDEDGKLFVITQINHKSGQWMRGRYPILSKDMLDPQKVGSGFSYAKRYALQAAFGIPTDDDDAQAASKTPKPYSAQSATKPTSAPHAGARAAKQQAGGGKVISEAQVKRLFAISHEYEVPTDCVKVIIAAHGFSSTKDITWSKYEAIINDIKAFSGSREKEIGEYDNDPVF